MFPKAYIFVLVYGVVYWTLIFTHPLSTLLKNYVFLVQTMHIWWVHNRLVLSKNLAPIFLNFQNETTWNIQEHVVPFKSQMPYSVSEICFLFRPISGCLQQYKPPPVPSLLSLSCLLVLPVNSLSFLLSVFMNLCIVCDGCHAQTWSSVRHNSHLILRFSPHSLIPPRGVPS